MAIRRIASYLGATAGALALALAPSVVHAATFNHIEVGGVTPSAAGIAVNGVGKAPITATLAAPIGTITCSSATASGKVYASDIKITSLALACPSIIPGSTVAIGIDSGKCPGGIVLTPDATQTALTRMVSATNPTGYVGPYDNPVTGTANFGASDPTACVKVTFKFLGAQICAFQIKGSAPWSFNEAPKGTKPGISQELTLGGTLTVTKVTGTCPVANGDEIDLSVPLNLTVPGSTNPPLIDFVP